VTINLAGIRARRLAFMVGRCSVSRYSETSTSDGMTAVWSDIASDVPCEIWPSGATAAEGLGASAGLRALSAWTIALPYGQDVTVRDRIIASDGRVFEVARADVRTYEASRDCICELVS
jgi:hypothetical protein